MSDKKILNVKMPNIIDSYYEDEDFQQELDKISIDNICASEQTRVIKNIRKTLASTLKKKYGFSNGELKELTTQILKIHGLDESNFDSLSNFNKMIDDYMNDVSIDANSNKNEKTIAALMKEVSLSNEKLIGYHMLYQVMKELYGQEEAKRLSGDMYDLSLALADSTNILKVYCYALDTTKLVTEGRKFGKLWSAPVHRVDSYINALDETIHQLSNHLAGAIAEATFFYDIAHILIYKMRIPFSRLKTDEKLRDYIVQCYQTFIHSVNHNSRNASESPFTNLSVFDREKLKTFISDENYGWYFPNKEAIAKDNEKETKFSKEEWQEFVLDYIIELQNMYLDFHEKGNPLANGMPYSFPVCTINGSKTDDGEVVDEDYLKDVCKRDIARFNIFYSQGTKIASCCRLISNKEMMDSLSSQVNSFGSGGASLGSHRVCTINFARIAYEAQSVKDFYKLLNKRIENSLKILKAHKVLIGKLEQKGLQPFITRGWIRMDRLFSTVGILGYYEANKIMCERFPDELKDKDFTGEFLTFLDEKVRDGGQKYGLITNIEGIPGESMAVKLRTVDHYIFNDDDIIQTPLYANQFVPLWENATIWEKLEKDATYNSKITGGMITHCQVGSQTTAAQNEKIIRFAVKKGAEHFAINRIFSKCNECGHTHDGKQERCENCGSENLDNYTRIVGFLTNVNKDWSKVRREWEFPRRTFVDDSLLN